MPRRPSTDRHGGARALALGLLALALQPIAASADPNPSDALHAIVAIQRAREGLVAAQRYMESRPDLFPARRLERERVLRPSLRADLLGAWQSISDYLLALGAVRDAHDGFLLARGSARGESLHLYRAAFLAQYRHALEIIERFERDPGFDKILDEPLPEIGLPRGSYARLKLHYLNVAIASEFAALEALAGTARTDPPEPLAEAIESDRSEIWRMGRGTGVRLTAANAGAVVEKTAFRAWFPVQAGVAEWMGDVKVWRPTHSLIGAAELDSALPRLEPGDILLTRREWYLSNLGLPGYWSHAALYLGTAAERDAAFDDRQTRVWVRAAGEPSGRLDDLLARTHPASHARSETTGDGESVRVLEAIAEGVVFTSFEHAGEADSLAVLRPRLPKREKAAAIARAFGYAGRPYDFDFDFVTDAALVCTELVYKAYLPAAEHRGLSLPLQSLLGRLALPANELARLYDREASRPDPQLELVIFLDGNERTGQASASTEAEFRKSWRRPKWHVLRAAPADAD
jgi:hypothetical protein